jgi:hypothetical protein
MPIEVYPVPVASSINASAITAINPNKMYEGIINFDAAVYRITCDVATVAIVEFYSGASTLIISATTSVGTVDVTLASAADRVRLWTDTGSNIAVTITKLASSLSDVFSGTLDTITSTGTYTGTSTSGYGYALIVGAGGGGGGGAGSGNGISAGGGGGSGSVAAKFVQLTGSMSVTIGSAGTGGAALANGNGGGSTNFASVTVPGGSGGLVGIANGAGGAGGAGGGAVTGTVLYSSVGSAGTSAGNSDIAVTATPTTAIYQFILENASTTAGGQGGSKSVASNSPAGSGLGTGGTAGKASSPAGGNGTGKGSGGGGGSTSTGAGGNGAPGVVYVLKV